MRRISIKVFMILTYLSFVAFLGVMVLIHSGTIAEASLEEHSATPIFMAVQGLSQQPERPPVPFDHDRHTTALKQDGTKGCAVCHLLKESSRSSLHQDVKVFKFPKAAYDRTDRKALMYAYHEACVGCHKKTAADGKKSGPPIGLCGKCHVRKPKIKKVVWAWSPVFNYARHAKHVRATEKPAEADGINVSGNVRIIGQTTGKKCETCHHIYDEKRKQLIYKKDCENSCRACHKPKDEKNVRSMKKVAHAACIGCHMRLAEKVKKEMVEQGINQLTEKDKRRFGPVDCKGCHEEHKTLNPDQIVKIPRLVRGQKDIMDISLVMAEKPVTGKTERSSSTVAARARMKVVPFNHKAHEPRTQFCNTCHHHSLEKCGNCHTVADKGRKGGGVSYEAAFHRAGAKQACVGCHEAAKKQRNCSGCHQNMPNVKPGSSCKVCHRGPSGGQSEEAAPIPLFQDKKKVPETLSIKNLEKEFKPAQFPHLKIVNKLVSISNGSSLARRFHGTKEVTLCAGCHHRSDLETASNKVPACISCHNRAFRPDSLGRPGILGAYHRQCIGCHQAMNQKPKALECVKCHPAKEGVRTANIIPSINEKP
ncbi:sulfate respiration complex hexadecaheme cytochrome HmcA [Thermodesulfobacteriota bacterium]